MDKPIIQSLWIGNHLSRIEQLCIASFLKNGHNFHLYTYQTLENCPSGVVIKDANQIIPQSQIFLSKNSYALFADWFRWKMLYEKGGFWVDMDIICLRPFDFESDIIFGFEGARVSNAVLGFPAKHQLCQLLAQICETPNQLLPYDKLRIKIKKILRRLLFAKRKNISWGEAGGPRALTNALKHFNMLHLTKPFTYFFPVHCANWKTIFDETLAQDTDLFADTYAIHLWNEMGRRSEGFDKNASFPENSLIEQLKSKYLYDVPFLP